MAQMGNLTYYTRINPETGIEYPVEGRQRVFISYRKVDSLADNLCGRLKDLILDAVDCAVWYDSALTPGQNYDEEIEEAIRACDAVVLLVTEHLFDSKYIWDNEIPWAKKYKKRVIPVDAVSDNSLRNQVEEVLGHIQFCLWDYASEEGNKLFSDYFSGVIAQYVTNASLRLRIEQCFAAGKQTLSRRYLTMEDRYLIGLGYLRGIGTEQDLDKAEKILRALINYGESDFSMEDLKKETLFQIKSHYQLMIAYALQENDTETILGYHKRGELFGFDLLHEMGYNLMSVLDSEYKKVLHQERSVADGAKLLRLRVEYYLRDTPYHPDKIGELADWASRFVGYVLHFIHAADKEFEAYLVKDLCQFCHSLLPVLENWDVLSAAGTLERLLASKRTVYVEPFAKGLKKEIPFDLYEFSKEPEVVKEQLLKAIVFNLVPLYTMSAEVAALLGHLFSDGRVIDRNGKLGLGFMDYGCLLDPSKRAEMNKMYANEHTVTTIYPAPYYPQAEHDPNPPHQGEIEVEGHRFYFIKVMRNTMYLMRDDCILREYVLWVGGGDVTSFSMTYDEKEKCLEILNYDLTHYDRTTTRYRIRVFDLAEEELRYEEIGLEDLDGRHYLPIR